MNKIMIVLVSLSFVARGMQNVDTLSVKVIVDEALRKSFSSENNHSDDCFNKFVQKLSKYTQGNEVLHQAVQKVEEQQYIVSTIAAVIKNMDYRRNYGYVAEKLAKFDTSYEQLYRSIQDAFDPNKDIQDKWYASVTKWVDRRDETDDHFGYNGGVITPLSLAIRTSNYDWCKKLIDQGADINVPSHGLDHSWLYPVDEIIITKDILNCFAKKHFAEKYIPVYCNIFSLLLKCGATFNRYSYNYGWHVLLIAIQKNDKDSALKLILHGVVLGHGVGTKDDWKWLQDLKHEYATKMIDYAQF